MHVSFRPSFILAIAGVALGLAVPVPAHAALSISHVLTEDGSPFLYANGSPPGATYSWTRCAPDCAGAPASTEQFFKPGPTAAGVAFQLSAVVDGNVVETGTSKVWGGTPTNTGLPTLVLGSAGPIIGLPGATQPASPLGTEPPGDLTVGQAITARPGAWTGGWAGDHADHGLRACRSTAAEGCVALLGTPRSAVIDPAYAGWYIGAYETRAGVDQVYTADFRSNPQGLSTLPAPGASPIRAFGALIGPVKALDKPAPIVDPPLGFTPKVVIRKRATKIAGKRVLGSIGCRTTCAATVVLTQRGKTVTRAVTMSGSHAITWPGKFTVKRSVGVRVRFLRTTFTASGTVKPA